MREIRWATDIDGVLCNFFQGIIQYSKKFGLRHHFPRRWTDLGTWLGPEEHFQTVYDACISDLKFWYDLKPIKNSWEAMALPGRRGPDLYLTARKIPTEWTQKWLEECGFPPAEVVTVGHTKDYKAMEYKLKVLKEKKIDIYVDDYPDTVRGLLENGIAAVLFDARHNRNENLPRISDFNGIYPIIATAEKSTFRGARDFLEVFFEGFEPDILKPVV